MSYSFWTINDVAYFLKTPWPLLCQNQS